MEPATIGASVALIGVVVAIVGWFVNDRLTRQRDEQKEKREREQAARVQVQNVFSACNRRALFTKMHGELDYEAMYYSLAACRASLKEIEPKIEGERPREQVRRIISLLDRIEREGAWHNRIPYFQRINEYKRMIILTLKNLSKTTGVPYNLPPETTKEAFFTLEEANEPPTGPVSLPSFLDYETGQPPPPPRFP